MTSFWRNIQSRCTPILFIKRKGGKIIVSLLAQTRLPALIAGVLRTVVIPIGSFAMGTVTTSLALTTGVLRTVVIPLGTFAMGTVTTSLALTTGVLRTVVINLGTYQLGTVTTSMALTAGEIKTIVRNIGTWQNTATQSMALISGSLTP